MPINPSRNEEEYFVRQEAERIKALKQEAQEASQRAERQSHFMKCPRCGGDLRVEHYQGIEVERCPDCHGLWFDEGEAQRLVELNASKGVGGVFRSIVEAVRHPTRPKKPTA
ncbi:MAG: zf-TFIIB domain-containing protein [Gemmatimonadota bacterium]|nr:zf-TFIIB domain-containing protein [Gemmatimonadota bacterium]